MNYINPVICLLMLLFIGVQYNDPDGLKWMFIYAVPALWAGLAFFKPAIYRLLVERRLWWATFAAAIIGMVYFWPSTPRWWASDVWWETETAREGMGMMIVTLALLLTRWCSAKR